MLYITEEILRDLCYEIAKKYFETREEPMGPYETRDAGKISACLANPKRSFGGVELYPDIFSKAAILYYGLVKAHAFENGNKRLATIATLTFLWINNLYIHMSPRELAELTIKIAESPASDHEKVLLELAIILKKHALERDHTLLE